MPPETKPRRDYDGDVERLARQVETSGYEWAADVADALRELHTRRKYDRGSFRVQIPMAATYDRIVIDLTEPRA